MLLRQFEEQDAAVGGPAVDADVGRSLGADLGEGGVVLFLVEVDLLAAALMLTAQPLGGIALGSLAAEDGVAVLRRRSAPGAGGLGCIGQPRLDRPGELELFLALAAVEGACPSTKIEQAKSY
jgi:hypothetical protein